MPYREVRVVDCLEVLRRWLARDGVRSIARATRLDRKTVRRFVKAAEEMDLRPGDSWPEEKIVAAFVTRVKHPRPPPPPSESEKALLDRRDQIQKWLEKDDLLLTKIHELLVREGVLVPYTALYRFARKWCDFGKRTVTVRKLEGKPGELAEVDFGRLGYIQELGSKRPRAVHGFIMILGYSRLACIVPVFREDLTSVIHCFEEAFRFFGGCPKRIVIDALKACVDLADPYVPRFNRTFLEYASFRGGFLPDPARPYHAKDKPVVERYVSFARERFYKGETFIDLEDVARRALAWCRDVAGRRIHGTTRCVPLEVFEAEERAVLIPLKPERFVIPRWGRCKVHPDHHIRFDSALYSVPTQYIGKEVDVRSDGSLVRIYVGAEVIKTHSQKPRGGRSTDYDDYPKERAPYAMRYPDFYRKKAREIGPATGTFADKLLEGEFPWSRLRQAQKLLRLADRYGAKRTEAACLRALSFDLIDVHRLGRILEQALEHGSASPTETLLEPVQQKLRFLRPAQHFSHQQMNQGGSYADSIRTQDHAETTEALGNAEHAARSPGLRS